MKRMLSAVLNPEDDGYVSLCPELDIASQGDTIEEALENLKEAVEGFLETASAEETQVRLSSDNPVCLETSFSYSMSPHAD